jgi:Mn-dependent DtxR family transcriptional regulator
MIRSMDLHDPTPDLPSWTFLTNHSHVLIAIARDPGLRQRDIAHAVGITVGAVQKIISELERAGYLRHERVGRRNTYEVLGELPLRHPLESHRTVGELLVALDD